MDQVNKALDSEEHFKISLATVQVVKEEEEKLSRFAKRNTFKGAERKQLKESFLKLVDLVAQI